MDVTLKFHIDFSEEEKSLVKCFLKNIETIAQNSAKEKRSPRKKEVEPKVIVQDEPEQVTKPTPEVKEPTPVVEDEREDEPEVKEPTPVVEDEPEDEPEHIEETPEEEENISAPEDDLPFSNDAEPVKDVDLEASRGHALYGGLISFDPTARDYEAILKESVKETLASGKWKDFFFSVNHTPTYETPVDPDDVDPDDVDPADVDKWHYYGYLLLTNLLYKISTSALTQILDAYPDLRNQSGIFNQLKHHIEQLIYVSIVRLHGDEKLKSIKREDGDTLPQDILNDVYGVLQHITLNDMLGDGAHVITDLEMRSIVKDARETLNKASENGSDPLILKTLNVDIRERLQYMGASSMLELNNAERHAFKWVIKSLVRAHIADINPELFEKLYGYKPHNGSAHLKP